MNEKAFVVTIRTTDTYADGMKAPFRANIRDDMRVLYTVQFIPFPYLDEGVPCGRLESLSEGVFDAFSVGSELPLFTGPTCIGVAVVRRVLRAHWVENDFIAHPEQPMRRMEWREE